MNQNISKQFRLLTYILLPTGLRYQYSTTNSLTTVENDAISTCRILLSEGLIESYTISPSLMINNTPDNPGLPWHQFVKRFYLSRQSMLRIASKHLMKAQHLQKHKKWKQ